MDKRFTLFLYSSVLLVIFYTTMLAYFFPPKKPAKIPQANVQQPADQAAKDDAAGANKEAADKEGANGAGGEKHAGEKPADIGAEGAAPADAKAQEEPAKAAEAPAQPPPPEPAWITLGSASHADPYRMLVTLTNQGAALERAELNSPRYRDVDDRSGYLGHLAAVDAPDGGGVLARVVGPGTPAAQAGLKAGDAITALDGHELRSAAEFAHLLEATEPDQSIELTLKDGRKLKATLSRRPLEIIRPELDNEPLPVIGVKHDPLSMLLTLAQVDERELADDAEELRGVELRKGTWEIVNANQDEAEFRKRLPVLGLDIIKRYRLAKVDPALGPDQPAYHLDLEVELVSSDGKEKEIAYRLEGPTGVVLEGAWYGTKIGRGLISGSGLRDVVTKFSTGKPEERTPATIIEGSDNVWSTVPVQGAPVAVQYVGVDAQYFTAAIIPDEKLSRDFTEIRALKVGATPKDAANNKLTDVSFRMTTGKFALAGEQPVKHSYKVFLGPRKPELLKEYGPPDARLGALIYYGWFDWVAEPMLKILHFFYHYITHNYGLAIIMLTVLVRGCMFPLSRKQAISSQKMQAIQPEMKALQEKYKKQPEQMAQAQRELYRKHNFNPLGGCAMAFVQLPIFIGLYRSLAVDVELRQAPLFSESARWCSNLAAPDMLWNWSRFMPAWVNEGNGFFGLGPYLNVFPLITIGLFLVQQKMFMPPATDEQTIMQQKIMKIMTIVMGVMFFKVPSGLCLYFIASSLWSVTERKLLLPPQTPPGAKSAVAVTSPTPDRSANGNGSAERGAGKKKQRGRK